MPTRNSAGPSDISIVILVMDRTENLRQCLASVRRAQGGENAEIIVVANGTPSSELAGLEEWNVKLLEAPVNLGFAAGCNWAAGQATGKYLLFLNDDAVVDKNWLPPLLDAMNDPKVGAAGSRIDYPDGRVQEIGSIIWSNGVTFAVGRDLAADTGEFSEPRTVDYCSACSLLVRRDAFEAAGGFDERYFPAYYEDVDLCFALQDAGYRMTVQPASRIIHTNYASTPDSGLRGFMSRKNHAIFMDKWGERIRAHTIEPDGERVSQAVIAELNRIASSKTSPAKNPLPEKKIFHAASSADDSIRRELTAIKRHIEFNRAWQLDQDKRIAAKEEEIYGLSLAVADAHRHIDLLKQEIAGIRDSRSVKLAMAVQTKAQRIAPRGSRLHRLLRGFMGLFTRVQPRG